MTNASGRIMKSNARPIVKTIGTVNNNIRQMQKPPSSLNFLMQGSMHRKQSPTGQARAITIGPIIRIPIRINRRLMTNQLNLKKVFAGSAALNC
jgi:hypothetical protein